MRSWLVGYPKAETKPLPERIAEAARELKLARRDGAADWIAKAALQLDALIDEIPRSTAQPQE